MQYTIPKAIFLSLVFSIGCTNNPATHDAESAGNEAVAEKEPVIPVFSTYRAALEAMRRSKDAGMVAKGTIEPERIKDFKGLNYFEPDSTWICRAGLELLKPEKVIFKTTDTRAPEYYRFCKFSFSRDGVRSVLMGYVDDTASPASIFVPFRDATGNKETYGGGRYIDLPYHGERTMIILDFNYAYNPYCHYNHNYSCPLVPEENVLTIPIFAGEKKLYE